MYSVLDMRRSVNNLYMLWDTIYILLCTLNGANVFRVLVMVDEMSFQCSIFLFQKKSQEQESQNKLRRLAGVLAGLQRGRTGPP